MEKTLKKINDNIIRRIYNKNAHIYDEHRRKLPNQWDLIEWPSVKEYISKFDNLLDAGCGTGIFIKQILDRKFEEIVGIDISEKMLEIAKKRVKSSKVKLLKANVKKIPFKDKHFDLVVCFDVLHYVKDIKKAFGEFYRVLDDGRYLIFSIRHPMRNLSYLAKDNSANYFMKGWHKESWDGLGDNGIYMFYRPLEEWLNILTNSGFNIKMLIESKPAKKVKIGYPEFYNKYTKLPRGLIVVAQKTN